jgi:alkylated DNA repair protein (DNA oxidative demethylase)
MTPSSFALLRGFALPHASELLAQIDAIQAQAPFRHMMTPGGFVMSVAMTSCGEWGWTTNRKGYRYTPDDPDTGRSWPTMPAVFASLARGAAAAGGFDAFEPDSCLINRYVPGSRLTLHQDRNEKDFGAPIVSVSLGIPATFLFGGRERRDRAERFRLEHGDVAVWGGRDRLRYHGVAPLKEAHHPLLGAQRINLTFRKAA